MRILVTGADGFLGRGLAAALADAPLHGQELVLTDRGFGGVSPLGVRTVTGDLGDPWFMAELLNPGFDLVFHLASIPGSLAEREQETGFRVNLQAPLALARSVAARRPGARFVFASSIAVYGHLGTQAVTPATATNPLLTYGAHKLMMEIVLSDMARRGELSAVSLRFPGIVARPLTESGHGSAFMSELFHRIRADQAFDCPVPADSRCWWMSRGAAVTALLQAARLTDAAQTVIQPPVLHATVGEVADAVMRLCGHGSPIRYGNDMVLQRIFGNMPPLDATQALALGFEADADLDALAQAVLSGDQSR